MSPSLSSEPPRDGLFGKGVRAGTRSESTQVEVLVTRHERRRTTATVLRKILKKLLRMWHTRITSLNLAHDARNRARVQASLFSESSECGPRIVKRSGWNDRKGLDWF